MRSKSVEEYECIGVSNTRYKRCNVLLWNTKDINNGRMSLYM
jgi:hypothetical protein